MAEQLHLPESLAMKFIFPHAPLRPVTINSGMVMRAWYDVYSFTDGNREDVDGLQHSQQLLEQLIIEEMEQGIEASRIIIGGFSQGAATVLYTTMRSQLKVGGVIALSGYLPQRHNIQHENKVNIDTPIFMAHGSEDPIIPMHAGQLSREYLRAHHYKVDWHDYLMGHEVCAEEIADMQGWIVKELRG